MPTPSIFSVELVESREATVSVDNPQYVLHYLVSGTLNDAVARAVLVGSSPPYYLSLARQQHTVKHVGDGVWECTVTYNKKVTKQPGTVTLSAETTGGKIKVTQAILQQNYVATGTATDYQGAIGTKTSGGTVKVEGTEIEEPGFSFTVSKQYGPPDNLLTATQLETCYTLAKHVNSDTVDVIIANLHLTFEPGSLLYHGCTFTQKGIDENGDFDASVELKFSFSPNIVGASLGGISYDKKGWHYLECIYEAEENNNRIIQAPVQINVSQVYQEADLMPLLT